MCVTPVVRINYLEESNSQNPERYAGGSVATGRVTQAGQVKG
jgi:hypothetical protein